MVTKTDYFITQMKLRELREQRSRLFRVYNELRQQVTAELGELERLRMLYRGLRRIAFADQELHPNVANLELLLNGEDEPSSMETVAFWRGRLENELNNGQLRSEIVYIFGAILEDWASNETGASQANAQRVNIQNEWIEYLRQPATTGNYAPLLDTLFADFAFDEDERARRLQITLSNHLQRSIQASELATALEQLSSSPYHSTSIHKQAQSFRVDTIMQKELADSLTIMLAHIDEWRRPQEGVPTRTLWTLTKWRLCFEEDLPTACFLEILGRRWQAALEQFFSIEKETAANNGSMAQFNNIFQAHHQGMPPLDAITQMFNQSMSSLNNPFQTRNQDTSSVDNNPFQIGSQFATMFQARTQGIHSFINSFTRHDYGMRASAYSNIDIWSQDVASENRVMGSIENERLKLKSSLHNIDTLASYDPLQSTSSMEKMVMLVHAEIELARASSSPIPLHILKIDLKSFYPSIPHQALLDILKRYGLTPSQQVFFQTFLHVPLQHNGQTVTTERGVPLYHRLSDILSELLLGLFEQYIQREARVEIFRLVDDIFILGTSVDEVQKAWDALHEFCEAFGLVLNQEKCGSISTNGERLPMQPDASPGWLLLTLNEQCQWDVNWQAFEHYIEQAREQVMQARSLIERIEIYNAHLQHLVKALGMRVNLGSTHRKTINSAIERFSRSCFSQELTAVAAIRQIIQERFLQKESTTHLPEAWLYWPITAGGCGLLDAATLKASYNAHLLQRQPVKAPRERPDGWQFDNSEWLSFYQSLVAEVDAIRPTSTKDMETLVNDFIERGSEVTNHYQADLSPYWRWILYIYGPQILDFLGTFRFLITELVPLQLIIQKYRQSDTFETSEG